MLATLPLYSAHDLRAALRDDDARRGPPALDRLDRPLACCPALGRIEVQVSTPWTSVARTLAAEAGIDADAFAAAFAPLGTTVGHAVESLPPLPDGTPFTEAVESIALVTADGELRSTSRARHAELLRLVLGGHGAIAVPYSVTLRIPVLLAALRRAEAPVEFDAATNRGSETCDTLIFYVPPAHVHRWLEEARRVARAFGISVAQVRVRRARPGSISFLDAAPEERALVELRVPRATTLPSRTTAAQVRKAWIDHAIALGGTFDLSTGFDASREQVEAGYPRFSAFLAEARRIDPRGRLAGRWLRHYAALFACGPVAGRWTNA